MNEEDVLNLVNVMDITRGAWFDIEYNDAPVRQLLYPSYLGDVCELGGSLLWLIFGAAPELVKASCHTSKLIQLSEKALHNREDWKAEQYVELWVAALNLLEHGAFADFQRRLADWNRLEDDGSISHNNKDWTSTYRLRHKFFTRSMRLTHALYGLLRSEMLRVPATEFPKARIAVLVSDIYQLRLTFLLFCAEAHGWYMPEEEELWSLDAKSVGVDLGNSSGPLVLKPNLPVSVDCTFSGDHGLLKWGTEWWGHRAYQGELFKTWTYETGQPCKHIEDIPLFRQVAYWVVDRIGGCLMEEQFQTIEQNARPLMDIRSVNETLNEVIDTIRDGVPKWLPGRRVDWTYFKRGREAVRSLEALLASGEEPAFVAGTHQSSTEPVDIPPDHQTRRISKTELAELWGLDQKVISQMMKAGALRAITLSRQNFIFDRTQLPTKVQQKLEQIG